MAPKLALGTVQFGAAYGINNKTGRVPESEVADILRKAVLSGIDMLDTAQAYGESEAVIGGMPALSGSFRIVSKFTAGPGLDPKSLLSGSLTRLNTSRLYAFLYHKFPDFGDYPGWFEELLRLKSEGSIEKVGFSVYYPHEIRSLLDRGIKFDLVQLPYSVFDRRFEPLFPELKKAGVEIHARSLFLQGLAFRDPEQLPFGLDRIKPRLDRLRRISEENSIKVSALCLCFGLLSPDIDRLVIGADCLADLEDTLSGIGKTREVAKVYDELRLLKEDNEDLILPFKWKK